MFSDAFPTAPGMADDPASREVGFHRGRVVAAVHDARAAALPPAVGVMPATRSFKLMRRDNVERLAGMGAMFDHHHRVARLTSVAQG